MTESFMMTMFQRDCASLPQAPTTAMKSTKVQTLSAVALHATYSTTACTDDAMTHLGYSLVFAMSCIL